MEIADRLEILRILLIDDNQSLRSSMGYYFRNKLSCFVALENAELALEKLQEQSFDVVICDHRLPGMDGLAFFKKLSRSHPGIKKILITAYGHLELEREAGKIGIHHLILKPFDSEQIERALLA